MLVKERPRGLALALGHLQKSERRRNLAASVPVLIVVSHRIVNVRATVMALAGRGYTPAE
jgi:hypothetical protein